MKNYIIFFLLFYFLSGCNPGNDEKVFSNDELSSVGDDFSSPQLSGDWNLFKMEMAAYGIESGQFFITPKEECVWWMKHSAPMIYKLVEGDFNISTIVRTRKASDTASYPEAAYQFGGIIIRDPSSDTTSGIENYVFNVIGYRGTKLQVEYKSTANGASSVRGYNWPSGDAELLIMRAGSAFHLYARELRKKNWQKIKTFYRPDISDTVQAGIIAYSFNYWKGGLDLTAKFDEIKFWRGKENDHKNIVTYPQLIEKEN